MLIACMHAFTVVIAMAQFCAERLLVKSTAKPCSGSLDVCDVVLKIYIDVCTQYA